LVRAAACETLGGYPISDALVALSAAAGDATRLVRVRAAAALSDYPQVTLSGPGAASVQKATDEYLVALLARPDSWDAHYNLGNYHLAHADPAKAVAEYALALKKEPQGVQTLVNSSIAYARLGQTEPAEAALQRALRLETNSAAALFNLGLLKAEQNDLAAAEKHLRAALKFDPQLAAAAYNLGVLLGRDHPEEALIWCKKAADIRSDEPKYTYTLAYFQREQGDPGAAQLTLQALIERQPTYGDAYLFLGDIFETTKRPREAEKIYRKLLGIEGLPAAFRQAAQAKLQVDIRNGFLASFLLHSVPEMADPGPDAVRISFAVADFRCTVFDPAAQHGGACNQANPQQGLYFPYIGFGRVIFKPRFLRDY